MNPNQSQILQQAQNIRFNLLEVGRKLHVFNPEKYDNQGYIIGDSFDEELELSKIQKQQYKQLKQQRIELQKQLREARIELAKYSDSLEETGLLTAESFDARHLKLLHNEQQLSFEIGKTLFTFEYPSLSYERYIEFQKLRVEAELSMPVMDFCNQFAAIYERFANSPI